MTNESTLTVNGAQHVVTAAPETPLLYVLRNELTLRGPHFGCGLAQCGACAVLVDGKEVRSCITPVSSVCRQNGDHHRGAGGCLGNRKILECRRCRQDFASGAASLDRRAGSAVRLLPKRDDDCGSAIVSQEPTSYRGRNKGCVHQHTAISPPLPLRDLHRNHCRRPTRCQGDGCLRGIYASKVRDTR